MPSVETLASDIANKLMAEYNDYVLCHQYAWWLLEALTKQKRTYLIEQKSFELTQEQKNTLASWIKKLTDESFPLQYLLGYVPFCDVEILVEPPVLIPRPETEEWTNRIAHALQHLKNHNIRILDLCTGSGCIAIALAKALPKAQIIAIDIEDHALLLAEKNCAHNNINNVTIIKSDLFESIPQNIKFDLIVGNPPYISPEEWQDLERSVHDWEDKRALVATDNGLSIIASIIKKAPSYLNPNEELKTEEIPQLVLEIGFRQAGLVTELLKHAGYCNIKIEKDLEGKDRVACAQVVPCGYINKQ